MEIISFQSFLLQIIDFEWNSLVFRVFVANREFALISRVFCKFDCVFAKMCVFTCVLAQKHQNIIFTWFSCNKGHNHRRKPQTTDGNPQTTDGNPQTTDGNLQPPIGFWPVQMSNVPFVSLLFMFCVLCVCLRVIVFFLCFLCFL